MTTTANRAARVTVHLDAEADAALDRAARAALLSRPNFVRHALSKVLRDAQAARPAAEPAR